MIRSMQTHNNENQLKEILNIFEQAELHVKELNDVVMKV